MPTKISMISAEDLKKRLANTAAQNKKKVVKKENPEKSAKKMAYIEKRREEKAAFREVLQAKSGAERISVLINDRKNVKGSVKAFIWKMANSLAAGQYPTLDTIKTETPEIYCPVQHTLIAVGEECYILPGFAGMRMSKDGFKAVSEFIETDEFKNNPRVKQEIERLKFEGGNISLNKKTVKALEESGLLKSEEQKSDT
jgi:hypothetical protein